MIELINYFGDDLMVANVARVSFAKEASNYTDEQNEKLVRYLWKHKHTSPFRHPQLQFRVECPIYVERQLFKHESGVSKNSLSGRYVDFSDSYTTINQWRTRSANVKQGSDGVVDMATELECDDIEHKVISTCKQAYKDLLELGVCKEQARTILPLCLNTQFIWTGSLQAFMHLCSLRLKPDAQLETRQVVQEMLELVKEIEGNPFKTSIEILEESLTPSKS